MYLNVQYTGLSLSGLLAFTTLTKSLQLVSPNLVSSLRCVELVMAFGVQSLITMEEPSPLSCLGAGLIIIGVIILAFHVSSDVSHWRFYDIMSRPRWRNWRMRLLDSSRILGDQVMKIWKLEDYLEVIPKLLRY